MAFLIDIGTGLVGKLVDYTVLSVGRQVGYLIYYNRNVKSLEDQLNDLVAANRSVEQRVGEEERNVREVEVPVNKWLTDVKKITEEANKILNEEQKEKMKCLCGLFPNLVVRHQLSRKSKKLVFDVAELYRKQKDFSTYAHAIIPQDVPSKDYEAFSSRTVVVNQIMDELRNSPNINMIGVYGFGGVGKTTLVKEVSRQATGDKTLFDDVAMILDVKQNPSIQRMQQEIAEKLGLDLPENMTVAGRARLLSSRIKDKKTLVILDDVWDGIDLEAVGLSGVTTCKVLLTSRTREVLSGKMHTQKEFALDLLGEEESWSLFKKKAGDVVKDPSIKAVATKVAKKCGGLPVLVVSVASALKNRSTLHAWKDALTRLKRLDKEEFTEKTYLALEWSYSQLNDEELKQLFLLCGLLANYMKNIYILDLFKYGLGLGLFKNLNTLGEAWDAINSLLEKLKDSCLLLDDEDIGWLKMHDLVLDVAKRISSREQHVLIVSGGDEFKEWPDNEDFYKKCSMISLEIPRVPKLPEVLQCTELKLLALGAIVHVEGNSLEMPCNFFKETTKLGVLDLSRVIIPTLPPSLQFLINLKTLCFNDCSLGDIALIGQLQNLEVLSFVDSKFKELPKEVGQLTHLRSLDLTGCTQLEIIAPGVISNLKRLEELCMGSSFNRWEAEGVISTERSNASLSELKHLSKLSALHIHILDANILPTDLFSNALERYQIYIGAAWNWDDADANLNTLKIKLTTTNELYQSGLNMLLKRTDELHLNGMDAGNNTAYNQLDGEEFQQLKHLHVRNAEFRHIINGKGVFPNLKRLVVSGIDGSRFLLSFSMARSLVQLTHLEISGCRTMKEIVSINESDEKHMKDMFSKLQHLELRGLPTLTRFCSRSCTGYPSLEILQQLENYDEVEEMDSRENIQNVLFDAKVVFPSLKGLFIDGLTKLMTVWHNQISPESFKNIETVEIYRCQSLKSVFPSSMVRNLQQLLRLYVGDCGVEEIIEDGVQTTYEFVLSKLNSVRFEDLPDLNCFYSGMHASCWPSLEALTVYGCSRVAFLAQECSRFQRKYDSMYPTPTNQALFLIKKDSFPSLKRVTISGMEIWDGPFPVNYFSKLEYFQVEKSNNESAAILEKFPGLEKYGETSAAASSEISSRRKSRSGDIHAVGALSHLSQLWLCGMPRLMHLGEDYSQMAGQNFPNLQILGIDCCDSLRNLRSSAISFKNLTNLQVNGCSGLEYLITYSTAKSLKQLIVLSVENCVRLVEIVGSREDDDNLGNEIVFSRLEYLELSKLPRLRGFCSRDCIVKFPSLDKLLISKRLKLKIFGNDETLHVTNEEVDTDVDADDGETYVDADDGETGVDLDDGEKTVQVTKENVDIDAGVDGDQSDETTHITNEKENENYDGSEHIQPLEITATDQGVIAPVGENLAILPVGEVTTPVFPVIEHTLVAEVTHTEAVEQVFLDIEPLAEEARPDVHRTLNEPEQHVKERSAPLEPSAAAKEILTPTIRAQAPQSSLKSSVEKLSLIVLLFTCSLWICIYLISLRHLTPGSICTSLPLCHVINPFHYLTSREQVRPFETTATDQEFIAPVQENNLAIIPVGEVRTPVFPVIEPPPVVEVPHTEEREQAFSGLNLEPVAEAARPDAHQNSNAPEQNLEVQSDPFEPSAVARITPTRIIPALPSSSSPKSSRAKRSLGEKLQDLSAKKAASNIDQSEEEKTKLKALISSAELRDPQTRQQLLAVLPTLQLSTTKWIADLVVQELSKLPLVLDKEESLRQKLAGLVAQGFELDERRRILLSEGSLAEENIQKVQEQKVELLTVEEQIKKLEAQAILLRAEIAIGEKRYSGFEASLDQLVEERQLNQLSVDSTSEELLRTRAVSDSLCTAIFTHLRQLL